MFCVARVREIGICEAFYGDWDEVITKGTKMSGEGSKAESELEKYLSFDCDDDSSIQIFSLEPISPE